MLCKLNKKFLAFFTAYYCKKGKPLRKLSARNLYLFYIFGVSLKGGLSSFFTFSE
jgi:hypothetical protein